MKKSGLDIKFDVTFKVNAYDADLLTLLFALLQKSEIELEEVGNIESIEILIDMLWDMALEIEFALDGLMGKDNISPHTREFIELRKRYHQIKND